MKNVFEATSWLQKRKRRLKGRQSSLAGQQSESALRGCEGGMKKRRRDDGWCQQHYAGHQHGTEPRAEETFTFLKS